ncbi:MAG: type II/IV secretion system protein [Candidatus Yanofskybacteria bacterium]|nr:type II/IV secretion system protein [Candidatus Yanofskybacteria bacterium]
MAQISTKQDLEKELEEKLSSIQVQKIEEETKATAQKSSLPYADLKIFPIDTNAVLIVDEKDARSGQLVVLSKTGQNLKIAVSDPQNQQTQLILNKLKTQGYAYGLVITSPLSLETAWQRYREKKERTEETHGVVTLKENELSDIEKQIKDIADLKERLTALPITKVLDILIAGALKIKASDIHFEPEEKVIRLRYRLDGVLSDVVDFSTEGYPNILSRIKLLSGLKINIHDSPQDGRFTVRREGQDIEVRVSILPGNYGENIVMRILDPTTIKQKLEDLGMREDILEQIKKLLEKTSGAILTTGPTGSGKTTTLYAFIKHVNKSDVKIITIEDPIEYHVEGVSQTQVDPKAGYTFAGGLRSIVRQDPDVILVGEIRDVETAEIAMQAALTGHLVFSTLHTNNASGTIPRLIDLGVRPITIAPAINAAMAQRLVRRLCQKCKKKEKISKEDLELLKKYLAVLPKNMEIPKLNESLEIFYPQQCQECNNTGYQGRVGIYELFEIDDEMEKLILTSPAISEVHGLAVKKGMITLLQDGLLKVLDGTTSIEEVMRVIGE